MSIKTFIFCDICNPQGIRTIEFRRAPRKDNRNGRRICDGRFWFDGSLTTALKNGWHLDSLGRHLCPYCKNNA